jgi:large-conductance mechanosensitive channel
MFKKILAWLDKNIIPIVGLIAIAIVSLYFFKFHHGFSDDNGKWGTFGDYIGGILNPIIAGFALYLIAKTYDLQKKELEETKQLLKLSTDAQENQIKLAALTALISSNFAKITILESEEIKWSEKLQLQEKEKINQRVNLDLGERLRTLNDSLKPSYTEIKYTEIRNEIKRLKSENDLYEEEIKKFIAK